MNETQASLRENLRALPRGAWILFFGTFLNKQTFLPLAVRWECGHLGALWARRVVRFAGWPARDAGGQQPARDLERAAHRPTLLAATVRVPGRRSRFLTSLFDDEPGDHPERLFAFGLWPGDLIEWRADRIVRAAIDHLHQANIRRGG